MVKITLCDRNSTAHKNALFPTKKQIVLMIIGAVLLTVLLAAVILAPIIVMGNKKIVKDTATPSPVLTEWMNYISDSAPICDIAIPGSHDSACYGMPYYAETQDLTIGEQLERGVRYFDIRVNNSKDGYVIFHGPVNGASYLDVLKGIDEFTDTHPSEFLILDMSHFKNGSEPMVFSLLEETLGDKILRLYRSEFSNKTVSEITLGEVRGKCLILTDASETDYYKNNPNINLRTNETIFTPSGTCCSRSTKSRTMRSRQNILSRRCCPYTLTEQNNSKAECSCCKRNSRIWRLCSDPVTAKGS